MIGSTVIERIERLIIIDGQFINPDKIICIDNMVFSDNPNERPSAYITFSGGGNTVLTHISATEFVELLKIKLDIDVVNLEQ